MVADAARSQHYNEDLLEIARELLPPPARAVNCVALRPVTTEVGGMKCRYLCSEARNQQLGRQPAAPILEAARELRY